MLLLGPRKIKQSGGKIPSKSHASQWGVKSVTIGMVAAAGVIVCSRIYQAQWLTFYPGAVDDLRRPDIHWNRDGNGD